MNSLTATAKNSYTLVDFFWGPTGEESHLGVTDANAALPRDGLIYLPEPSMEIVLAATSGGLNDKNIAIDLPTTGQQDQISEFALAISSGQAWPPTSVRIREIQMSPSDGSEERTLYHFEGRMARALRNAEGKPNMVRAEASWEKTRLKNRRLGIIATEDCSFIYGGEGCRRPIELYPAGAGNNAGQKHYVRMSPQNGTFVTLEPDSQNPTEFGFIGGPTQGIDKWSAGFLEADGLRILIREYRPWTYAFILSRRPPDDWDYLASGKVLMLHPGCKRTPFDCYVRANTPNFGGLGWGMPAYNPIAEEVER